MKLRREMVRSVAGWRSRRSAMRAAAAAPPPAPFVVGATRSGTTLLRLMLDAHPELAIPSETHFIPELIAAREKHGASRERMLELLTSHRRWGDFGLDPDELAARWAAIEPLTGADAVRAFFHLYGEKQGKPDRWGDKTPGYVKLMRPIQTFLPEARFIHLIRDGRDVALSRWKRSLGKDPAPASQVAETWARRIRRAQRHGRKVSHYLELRYEELVTDTEPNLRRIAEFIELGWDPVMMRYYEHAADRMAEMARDLPAGDGKPTRPGEERMQAHAMTQKPPDPGAMYRWKEKMSPQDIAAFEAAAGELLAELGYEVGTAAGTGGA